MRARSGTFEPWRKGHTTDCSGMRCEMSLTQGLDTRGIPVHENWTRSRFTLRTFPLAMVLREEGACAICRTEGSLKRKIVHTERSCKAVYFMDVIAEHHEASDDLRVLSDSTEEGRLKGTHESPSVALFAPMRLPTVWSTGEAMFGTVMCGLDTARRICAARWSELKKFCL